MEKDAEDVVVSGECSASTDDLDSLPQRCMGKDTEDAVVSCECRASADDLISSDCKAAPCVKERRTSGGAPPHHLSCPSRSLPSAASASSCRTLQPPEAAVIEARNRQGEDVPSTIRSFAVLNDPKLSMAPGFVSDAEIQHLLELAEACQGWVPSVVWRGGDARSRKSDSFMLRSAQTPVVEAIELRVAAFAGVPVEHVERLNLLRYTPDQFYSVHHDGRSRPKTVFIYLNDVEEGGETRFPRLGIQLKPIKGCAALWSNLLPNGCMDSRMEHEGLPPKRGLKYALNCFICRTQRGAANEWPGLENTGNVMESWWTRSSVGVREIRELSFRKLAEAHLPPEDFRALAGNAADPEEAAVQEGEREGRGISMIEICNSPWISIIPGLLDPCEVCSILSLCKNRPEQEWQLAHRDPRLGTSETVPLASFAPEHAREVVERFAELLGVDPSSVEEPDLERFLPGQFVFERHGGMQRSHSAVVYLTEVPSSLEDGMTDLKHTTFQFRPDLAGTAAVWRNHLSNAEGERLDDRLRLTEMPFERARYHVTCHVRMLPPTAACI